MRRAAVTWHRHFARYASLIAALCLVNCGTEVGNGNKDEDEQSDRKVVSESGTGTPTSDNNAAEGLTAPASAMAASLIFNSCASPFESVLESEFVMLGNLVLDAASSSATLSISLSSHRWIGTVIEDSTDHGKFAYDQNTNSGGRFNAETGTISEAVITCGAVTTTDGVVLAGVTGTLTRKTVAMAAGDGSAYVMTWHVLPNGAESGVDRLIQISITGSALTATFNWQSGS